MLKKHRVYLIFIAAAIYLALAVFARSYMTRDRYIHQPPPELPTPPLKELAERRGLYIGSFASLKYLRERPYSELLKDQFEFLIIDGEPNWQFENYQLRPALNKYDFSNLDHVFSFADETDMPVRVQHLLWGDEKWLPSWLTHGNYNKQQLLDIIKQHIVTVTGRYKGKVREYSVVNEAFSRKLLTGGNHDWWGEHLGTEYIDDAFIWTHQTDPNAVLILNDFGDETEGDISNLMYDYVKGAKSRGVPIDAIGMQMHIDATNAPQKEKVVSNMRRFAGLGVKVYITEFDVNMHGLKDTKAKEDEIQANIYGDMLGACLEVGKDICPSFGFLGLTDRQSWYHGIGVDDANPLMFDDNYKPKPAFFKVREVLQNSSKK